MNVGDIVECRIPGRRVFISTVVRVRDDAIDVTDPRNGGLRTLPDRWVAAKRNKRSGRERDGD